MTCADAEEGGDGLALKASVEAARAAISDHIDQAVAKMQQRDTLLYQAETAIAAAAHARAEREQAGAALAQQQAMLGGVAVSVYSSSLECETQARLDVQKGIDAEEAAIAALEADLRVAQQAMDASRSILEANDRLAHLATKTCENAIFAVQSCTMRRSLADERSKGLYQEAQRYASILSSLSGVAVVV